MQLGPIQIIDAHAEAFAACYARLLVTADDSHWLDAAIAAVSGYGTSLIGCDAEIAVEQRSAPVATPDGRPGVKLLAFAFNQEKLGQAVANRVGQGLLTCPTAAIFDGLPDAASRLRLGDHLRYFGDGHETTTGDGWSLPIMESEVRLPATVGTERGVAGGNLLLLGAEQALTLAAARRAVDAVADLPGVITPFPGGVCRSGSKVGSRYRGLVASTNEDFCPSLAGSPTSKIPEGVRCVYEIILNGVDEQAVRTAMQAAIHAAAAEGLLAITASDYGGKLGKIRIPLSELL